MKLKKFGLLLVGTAAFAASAGVLAHGGATGIVKQRMDGMKAMGDAVKEISAMFRSGTYDADLVKSGAEVIKKHAGEALLEVFPEGTDGAPSEAKPAIWTQWDEFAELANELAIAADALNAKADASAGGASSGGAMGSGMMGGNAMNETMMGGSAMVDADMLAQMPVDGVFNATVQVCSSCHSKFRIEKK